MGYGSSLAREVENLVWGEALGLLVTLRGGRRSGLVPGILKISASHSVE